jgi:predicted porin
MRNTKIALAVLALVASTAAMAQASVYGSVDAGVSQIDGGKTTFGGFGNWAGNVMGVNASQDLDNGMKASANFELGYDIGSGNNGANGGVAAGNPFFNRKANASLSGEFGTVTAGLQFTPFVGAAIGGSAITNNQSFYVTSLGLAGSNVSGAGGATANPSTGFFIPNAISYSTPSIGGFSAKVLGQVTGTTSNTNDTNDNKYTAYAASYAMGDATINAGYQKRDGAFAAATAATGATNYSSMALSGSYAMGATTLGAGYISHEINPTISTSSKVNVIYGIVSQKVSDTLIASLGYAQNNATTKASMLNIGLQYNLNSKGTTYLYATGGQGNKTAVGPIYATTGDATTSTKGYAVGIVTGF